MVAAAQMLLAGGLAVGVRVGLRAGWFGGGAGRFKILLWPRLMPPWVLRGREGGEAVDTSQDEPAMTKVLRRWPRKSRSTGGLWKIPWASASECGRPSRSRPHLQNRFLCMKPSDTRADIILHGALTYGRPLR